MVKLQRRAHTIEIEAEGKILLFMILSDEYCHAIVPKLEYRYFRADYVRNIAQWVAEYYDTYKKAPKGHMRDIYDSKKPKLKEAEAEFIERFLTNIDAAHAATKEPDFNTEYLINEAEDYFQSRRLDILAEDIKSALSIGRTQQAEHLLAEYQQSPAQPTIRFSQESLQLAQSATTVVYCKNTTDVNALKPFLADKEEATLWPARAGQLADEHKTLFANKDIMMVVPRNPADEQHALQLARAMARDVRSMRIILVPGKKKSFAEWMDNQVEQQMEQAGDDEITRSLAEANIGEWYKHAKTFAHDYALEHMDKALRRYVIKGKDLLSQQLPRRETLMEPFIREGSLVLLFADSGHGKTWLAAEIAAAIQTGRNAMADTWEVKTRAEVLYVDGEMDIPDLRDRIKCRGFGEVNILSAMFFELRGVPTPFKINNEQHRQWLTEYIDEFGIRFLVLDNLVSLTGYDPKASQRWDQEWSPVNEWLLRLRGRGVAVVLIHHTNQAGKQFGAHLRKAQMNYSFKLEKCYPVLKDKQAEEITNEDREQIAFTVHVDKQRGRGLGVEGLIYQCDDGQWAVHEDYYDDEKPKRDEAKFRQVAELLLRGWQQNHIAKKLALTKGRISQMAREMVEGWDDEKAWLVKQGNKFTGWTEHAKEKFDLLNNQEEE